MYVNRTQLRQIHKSRPEAQTITYECQGRQLKFNKMKCERSKQNDGKKAKIRIEKQITSRWSKKKRKNVQIYI